MTFLNSSVLYFLPLLAVPIIIHLLNLYKPKKVYFPKLDILEKIAETSSTRLKIKNWLILLARLFFVLFLILTFAQPYFPNQDSNNKKGTVLLYLDTSPSMFIQENGYQPISEATAIAFNILNGLNKSQQVYVMTNEFSFLDKTLLTKEQAKERLLNLNTDLNHRSVQSIENRIELLFGEEDLSKVFLISDFQNQKMSNFESFNDEAVLIPINQGVYPNTVVDSVWFDSPAMISNKNVKLNIRLKSFNLSDQLSSGIEVSILGEVITSQQVLWSANETEKMLSINFDLGRPGLYSAKIKLDDVPVNFDNQFYFVFEVLDKLDITIVSNNSASTLLKVFMNEPLFNAINFRDGEIDQQHVLKSNLLVVEGFEVVANNLDLIRSKLDQGASVLVLPEKQDQDYTALSNYFNVSTTSDTNRYELEVNEHHPYFKGVLSNSSDNIVKPWYTTNLKVNESLSYILHNKFKKGGIGFKNELNGKIGLIPFPLSNERTNLHRHAFFLPLMYEIAFRSNIGKKQLFYRTNNRVVGLPVKNKTTVLELSADNKVILAHRVDKQYRLGLQAAAGVFYINDSIKSPVLAINHDLIESKIDFPIPEDYNDLKNVEVIQSADNLKMNAYFKNLSLGFSLWKYCLILSILFLTVEIFLIRLLR